MIERQVWTCRQCGESVEEQFGACWNCGADREGGMTGNFDGQNPDAKEKVVCPNCMTANAEGSHFCRQCATPLTSHDEIDPIGQIYATGDMYRKAAGRPGRLGVLVGMWLIFGPQAVLMSIGLLHNYDSWMRDDIPALSLFVRLLMVALTGVYIALLYKVTRNYFRGKAMAIPMVNEQDIKQE